MSTKVNSLIVKYPELIKEWNREKNDLSPGDFSCSSQKKVWWRCKKGHEWEARIADRTKGQGCPYCSNRRVLPGYNDLATTHPNLAAEWHPTRNGDLTPQKVTYGINRLKPWWKCSRCGHEWQATILSRSKGRGCPDCGKEIQKKLRLKTMLRGGDNSLASVRPDLASEWHPTKNGGKKPEQFTASSNQKVWWKCTKCGYEWEATINHRAKGRGCRKCNQKSTSFSEQAVFYYLKAAFPDAVSRDTSFGFELDIYIPSINTAIEYDGLFFHGKNKRGMSDEKKDVLCKDNGIRIIRIREKGLPKTQYAYIITRENSSESELEKCIEELFDLLNVNPASGPNIKNDIAAINSQYEENIKQNSLASLYPEVARRWHPTRNGDLMPDQVSAHSDRKVWWTCDNGHEYYQKISAASAGIGCDVCGRQETGKKLQTRGLKVGVNDLKTLFPDIADEWDYEKNDDRPEDYKAGSNKNKAWICKHCQNRWSTKISNRTLSGKGCPACAKERTRKSKIKSVECVETGRVFPSLEEASKWAGVSRSAISYCASGKTKTSGGYHWRYEDKE